MIVLPKLHKRAWKRFALAVILLCSITLVNAQNKPNVIFILGDDIGYDVLSVNGNKSYHTPNIDSMAHHGINFTHCEATPLCSPSRCMLLTGKYNFRNYNNWGYLSDTAQTFGNLMRDAGYKTAFFGKLQLQCSPARMDKWGFDKFTIFEVTEDSMVDFRYKTPTLVDNNGLIPDSLVTNKYCDDILTQHVLDFIDSNKNTPFFIYYPTSVAHVPFSPTPSDTDFPSWPGHSSKSDTAFFASMVNWMDAKVGLILNKLKETGLDKNTIIIFGGDNGTPTQIYYNVNNLVHIEGEKARSNERGTHVPLIAYWPSHIKDAQVNDDLIDFSDFFPTFAETAGISDLSKFGPLDGLSFYKRMLGTEDTSKQQLFFHYDPHPGFDSLKRWVMNKYYKLYDSTGGANYQFYNILNDILEKHPISDAQLTWNEKKIKTKFLRILDSMPTWPLVPQLSNPYVKNITSNSVTVGATILNSGSSRLTERGSNFLIGTPYFPVLGVHRQADSVVSLGTFEQIRNDLASQTLYWYSAYAINSGQSHNTGYAIGTTFYTLSAPPTVQPSFLHACTDSSFILLSWNSALFPKKGATLGGYDLFYSTDSIHLIEHPNGIKPSLITKDGIFIPLTSIQLPSEPDTFLRISNLPTNIAYHFLLIPYTRNAITDSTCNYLTTGALSITTTPYHGHLKLSLSDNSGCYGKNDANIAAEGSNGTSPYMYSINSNNFKPDSVFSNLSAGSYKIKVEDDNGCYDSVSTIIQTVSQLKLNLANEDVSCSGNGSVIASAQGGLSPYVFSFNNSTFDTISNFNNLSAGNYKVTLRDANQCTISSTVSILPLSGNCSSNILITPNPSSNYFNILVDASRLTDRIKIRVYNGVGKLVYSTYGNQVSAYKFGDDLAKGVYFISVESGSDTFKFRVIKN